jgi:hypothetical protein
MATPNIIWVMKSRKTVTKKTYAQGFAAETGGKETVWNI